MHSAGYTAEEVARMSALEELGPQLAFWACPPGVRQTVKTLLTCPALDELLKVPEITYEFECGISGDCCGGRDAGT